MIILIESSLRKGVAMLNHILAIAQDIFDVAGITENILVCGLVASKERDLDSLFKKNGKLFFPGYHKYFKPRITSLLEKLPEINLMQIRGKNFPMRLMALHAGLGKLGKNALIIHSTYGPWLRFVAFRFKTEFQIKPQTISVKYDHCQNCELCASACPSKLVGHFTLTAPDKCLANPNHPECSPQKRCNNCLQACLAQPKS